MSRRSALGVIAGLALAFGLFLGMGSTEVGHVDCGSVFAPESESTLRLRDTAARIAGSANSEAHYTDACAAARDDRQPWMLLAFGVSAAAFIASFLVPDPA